MTVSASGKTPIVWISVVDFAVAETSTRFQRLSTLCGHYALSSILTAPLDDRYPPSDQVTVEGATTGNLSELFRAAWRARKNSAALVSASSEPRSLLAAVIAKAGRPFVVHVWDDPAKMARLRADVAAPGWRRRLAQARTQSVERLTRRILSEADLIVLSLDPERIAPLYAIEDDQLLAVPNGALIEPFNLPSVASYACLQQPPRVVYTGPLQTNRIEPLLDAAAELHRRNVPVTVQLWGPETPPHRDPQIGELLARASDNVEIIAGMHSGSVLQHAVAEADICVIPYRDTFEIDCAYPIKLFEYFSAAKPVVSSNLWGVRQVATDGHDVVVVPPGDSVQLANAIESLLGDPDRRAHLGRNARATAVAHPWGRINKLVVDAMDRVVERSEVPIA